MVQLCNKDYREQHTRPNRHINGLCYVEHSIQRRRLPKRRATQFANLGGEQDCWIEQRMGTGC